MTRLAAALVAALTLFVLSASAQATSFPVTKTADTNDGTCDADCSLREAITAANNNPGPDAISVPGGTYKLTIPAGVNDDDNTGGDLDITSDMTISGAGTGTTVVDATGLGDRVFNLPVFSTTNSVTISDLTITGGQAPGGGGFTTVDGGGVESLANLTLNRVAVTGNATAGTTGEGGGVTEDGGGTTLVAIRNSTISGNRASFGGGVAENGGATNPSGDAGIVIEDTTVSGNTVTDANGADGGGVIEDGGGELHIRRSTITGNTASAPDAFGGGLATNGGSSNVELTNSTITGNTADGSESYGGGYGEGGGDTVSITNSTIAGNHNTGSGVTPKHQATEVAQAGAGTITFKNTIIGQGSPNSCGEDNPGGGTFTSNGNNIDRDGTCNFHAAGDQPGVDPKLGPLGDYGGPTFTINLLTGSPAIDHGDNAACPATDQRGFGRPNPAGGVCDVGAYERVDADVSVTDQPSAATVFVGQSVTDTITVRNSGPNPADGVTLGEPVPPGLSVVSAPGCSAGPAITCGLGTLAPGQAATISVTLRGDAPLQATHTATATLGKGIDDPNAANNSASVALSVLPPPALKPKRGASVLASVVKGKVLISTPVGASAPSARALRPKAAVKPPRGYTPFRQLTAATLIPMRSLLDTTHGTVRLTTAVDAGGTRDQSGTFNQGAFTVTQGAASPLTTVSMTGGGNFSTGCVKKKSRKASAARSRPHRSLVSNVRGRFRTRGRNSTATARGTAWLTKDTCAGTLTSVTRGVVVVRDLTKRKNITLKAHHKYLARPRH